MAKRHFMMVPHKYKDQDISGWWLSEKLDGERCYWDGGITRGMLKADVPWANTEKDARYKIPQVATGLWSRYANVIHAPDWWLDKMPLYPLDGELKIKGYRQELHSIIKKLVPGKGWRKVFFAIFDQPFDGHIFMDGIINLPNMHKTFENIPAWIKERTSLREPEPKIFADVLRFFDSFTTNHAIVRIIKQTKLSIYPSEAQEQALAELNRISDAGGEGIVLRKGISIWYPERSHNILKAKKLDDAEGFVIGYRTGKITDKGSKNRGKLGALIINYEGIVFELSGFTDEERTLNKSDWAYDNPDQECPDDVFAVHFPIGTDVTFKYRGTSRDGVPQEARYWRKREEL